MATGGGGDNFSEGGGPKEKRTLRYRAKMHSSQTIIKKSSGKRITWVGRDREGSKGDRVLRERFKELLELGKELPRGCLQMSRTKNRQPGYGTIAQKGGKDWYNNLKGER